MIRVMKVRGGGEREIRGYFVSPTTASGSKKPRLDRFKGEGLPLRLTVLHWRFFERVYWRKTLRVLL